MRCLGRWLICEAASTSNRQCLCHLRRSDGLFMSHSGRWLICASNHPSACVINEVAYLEAASAQNHLSACVINEVAYLEAAGASNHLNACVINKVAYLKATSAQNHLSACVTKETCGLFLEAASTSNHLSGSAKCTYILKPPSIMQQVCNGERPMIKDPRFIK